MRPTYIFNSLLMFLLTESEVVNVFYIWLKKNFLNSRACHIIHHAPCVIWFPFVFRLCNGLCISVSTFSCVLLLYQSRGGSDFIPCTSDISRQDCKDLPCVEYDCHDPWLPHGGEWKSGARPSSGRSVSAPTAPKSGQCHTSCYSSPCASVEDLSHSSSCCSLFVWYFIS